MRKVYYQHSFYSFPVAVQAQSKSTNSSSYRTALGCESVGWRRNFPETFFQ